MLLPFFAVGWNPRNLSPLEYLLLLFSGFLPNIDKLVIDPDLPDHGIVTKSARQGPIDIEPPDAEHPLDSHAFALAGAIGYAKFGIDVDQLHGRTLGIIQHVRPTDGSDDPAGPDFLAASGKRGRPLSSQGHGQPPTHLDVFLVQVPLAEGVGQDNYRLELGQDLLGNGG